MKSLSRIALGVALAAGGGSLVLAPPAVAQGKKAAVQPQLKLSKAERTALAPLQAAAAARDAGAFAAALPAAQSAAQSGAARYAVARLQLDMAIATNNGPAQAQAIEAIVASGAAPPEGMLALYQNQAALAVQANNLQKAEAALNRVIELSPNDPQAMVDLARVKYNARKPQEAVPLIERAIAARTTAGQPAPEAWYRYGLRLAFDSRMAPQSFKLARELVTYYPSPVNWRDALLVHRDLSPPDAEARLDLMRLQRAAGALAGERDYLQFAEALSAGKLGGESKAVLDEGVAARMASASEAKFKALITSSGKAAATEKSGLKARETAALAASTGGAALAAGDSYLSQANYASAATLYRAALQKGSVDAALVNTRLGIALAMAGQRAEAEGAFRAVTGPRADLAGLWLAWLSRRT